MLYTLLLLKETVAEALQEIMIFDWEIHSLGKSVYSEECIRWEYWGGGAGRATMGAFLLLSPHKHPEHLE